MILNYAETTRGACSSVKVKLVPWPSVESRWKEALIFSSISLQMYKPSPVPGAAVVAR